MDEEPQSGLETSGSSVPPQEQLPPSEFMDEVIRSSFVRLDTWVRSIRGRDKGGYLIKSEDELDGTAKTRISLQRPSLQNILSSDSNLKAISSQVISVEDVGQFPNGQNVWWDKRLMNLIEENPIVEVVYLAPIIDLDRRVEPYTEREQVGKNIIGKPKFRTVQKERVSWENPHTIPFNSLVSGESLPNTDEPAAIFIYNLDSMPIDSVRMEKGKREYGYSYVDLIGRRNNHFTVVAVIPEGVAIKMQDKMREDPLLARAIALSMVDNKFALPDGSYRRPNFPDMIGEGLKMYLALDMERPITGKLHVFDPSGLVDIDSEMAKPSAT